jgi:hypothetical protein
LASGPSPGTPGLWASTRGGWHPIYFIRSLAIYPNHGSLFVEVMSQIPRMIDDLWQQSNFLTDSILAKHTSFANSIVFPLEPQNMLSLRTVTYASQR